jgi:hypothetical protein
VSGAEKIAAGPTASTLAGFWTPASEKSHAGRILHPRSVRKSPEPSWTLVVRRGGGEPRTLLEAVNVLNAPEAAMMGSPFTLFGVEGQLAGAAIWPFPNAILLSSSGNPFSGARTYPSNKTRGRGDDATGNRAHVRRARVSRALSLPPFA